MKATDENTSVSRLVGKMLEEQMKHSNAYREAYRQWREIEPMGLGAANRLTREEAHERS
jgi:hypothetical protein